MNKLMYGDNLHWLPQIEDECVDLVYIDPPNNSDRKFNVLFRERGGEPSQAQVQVFDDTWRWARAEPYYNRFVETCQNQALVRLMEGMIPAVQPNIMAYMTMMAPRLIHLHRVLKPTGTLYLHSDPKVSPYMKVMLDVIFGHNPKALRDIIAWKRTSAHSNANHFGPVRDDLLVFSKGAKYYWNQVYTPHSEKHLKSSYRNVDEKGRRYTLADIMGEGIRSPDCDAGRPWRGIDPALRGRRGNHWKTTLEMRERLMREGRIVWSSKGTPRKVTYLTPGVRLQNMWLDIPPAKLKERVGYPTEKPIKLVERVLEASCPPKGVLLDAFAGCGTAIEAAQKTGRKWIGIDLTYIALGIIRAQRLSKYPEARYEVLGKPLDLASARRLAQENFFQFQLWAMAEAGVEGLENHTTPDKRTVYGYLRFVDQDTTASLILQAVPSATPKAIAALRAEMRTNRCAGGVLLALDQHTCSKSSDTYVFNQKHYPKFQVIAISSLIEHHQKSICLP